MPDSLTIRNKLDVVEMINGGLIKGGNSLWIVVIALGGVFIDAYDFTSLGIGAVQLRQQFHLTAFQLGSVTAAMAFGALVGATFGGYYVDKIGRERMFLINMLFFVIAAIGAAFSPNYWVLIFFRFFMGVGVGMDFPVAMSFVAEYTATSGKGKYLNLWQGMWYIAAVVVGLASLPILFAGAGGNLWRWAVGLGAVPAFAVLLLRQKYLEESPMWLAQRGDLAGAARVITKAYGVPIEVAQEAEAAPTTGKYSLRDYAQIFSKPYRMRTLLASIIAPTQSMEYFAVGFYLPVISVLLFGNQLVYAILGTVFFNLFGIVGGLSQAFLTQRIGVRRLAIIGYCLVVVALLVSGIGGKALPLVLGAAMLALFVFGHSFGPGSQGMTMAAMSFPTAIRGAGTGWVQAVLRLGSIFGFYFFPLVLAASGLSRTLLILTVVPILGLLACLAIRWEPVGQDVEAERTQLAAGTVAAPIVTT